MPLEGVPVPFERVLATGDCRRGRRPSFSQAAPPAEAEALYERFMGDLEARGVAVQGGKFQAMMEVELVNDGPVTLMVETPGEGG